METFPKEIIYGYPSAEPNTDFSTATSCFYHETLHYAGPNGPLIRTSEGELDHSTLAPWLENVGAMMYSGTEDSQTKESFTGGLKLLYGTCSFDSNSQCRVLPFRMDDFITTANYLRLPTEFLPTLRGWASNTFSSLYNPSKLVPSHPSRCFVFKISLFHGGQYVLAVTYYYKSNLTYAILLRKHQHEFDTQYTFLDDFTSSPLSTHPLSLPIHIIGMSINSSSIRLQWADDIITKFEQDTGQHEWSDMRVGDPMEMDFSSATRMLNFIYRSLAMEITRYKWNLNALDNIVKYIDTLSVENANTQILVESGERLRDLVAYQISTCQYNMIRAEFQEKKAQSQLAVVYQLMAQKDSKTNIRLAETTTEIAKEGKKDSSAMKSIAVLTMCFLPGTFLAAIFAMPLFNWDDNNRPVIKNKLKYYWMIAIPLTVLVLLLWTAAVWLPWTRWMSKIRNKQKPSDVETTHIGGFKIE